MRRKQTMARLSNTGPESAEATDSVGALPQQKPRVLKLNKMGGMAGQSAPDLRAVQERERQASDKGAAGRRGSAFTLHHAACCRLGSSLTGPLC